ncbi:hypothetical protein BSK62_22035 [Paenibacillus odorifer]|uniref:hypothetical protein n=1 Tax=Paenibacillus odorifer TaxID=189426 RepID=UPI00096C324E|nr:hypothetical protein [Paenibacillus odorifer]OMD62990.1 hypothetical protein BSK62_22035 [Paenibacillus odorifer]
MTNKEKETICQRYKAYLQIIYRLGNKVIIMKQLFAYAKVLGITETYSVFLGHIHEMVSAEIVRQEAFTAYNKVTSLHMITLRKFGIRYLEGKQNSQDVGAVPKSNTNERILISLYKNCYILKIIVPRIMKTETKVTLECIVSILESDKSTLLFNKNQGLEYMTHYLSSFEKYLDRGSYEWDIKELQLVKSKRMEGLKKGSKASSGKGVGNHFSCNDNALKKADYKFEDNRERYKIADKQRKMDFYTFDSMLTAFIYIAQMKLRYDENGDCYLAITILIFDINNKKDIYSIATHIACVYKMLKRYYMDDMRLNLKVGVVSLDEEASKLVQAEADKVVRDPRSKEARGKWLENTLSAWGITPQDRDCIQVHYTHYDITDRFLEGKKYLNLIRK